MMTRSKNLREFFHPFLITSIFIHKQFFQESLKLLFFIKSLKNNNIHPRTE